MLALCENVDIFHTMHLALNLDMIKMQYILLLTDLNGRGGRLDAIGRWEVEEERRATWGGGPAQRHLLSNSGSHSAKLPPAVMVEENCGQQNIVVGIW